MNKACLVHIKSSLTILVISLTSVHMLHAQYWNGQDSVFGHEWINFEQEYYKFKVAEDGIYRLDRDILLQNGIPVDQIAARHIQVWHLGREIPIHSSTRDIMSDVDHLILYARKNRGEFDGHLYPKGKEDQFNPDYSLFSDTSTYFITWNEEVEGKRVAEVINDLTNLPAEEAFFMAEENIVFNDHYFNFCQDINCYLIYSNYDHAEGWGYFSGKNTSSFDIDPEYIYDDGPDAKLIIRSSNNIQSSRTPGEFSISLNGEELSSNSYSQRPEIFNDTLDLTQDQLSSKMNIKIEGQASNDYIVFAKIQLNYPRRFQFGGLDYYELTVEPSATDKNILIQNFNGGDHIQIWNLTTDEIIKAEAETPNNYRFRLRAHNRIQRLVIAGEHQNLTSISDIDPVTFVDYTNVDPDYIIITHSKFLDDGLGNNYVQEYADYRASEEGGEYTPLIVPIDILEDQFAHGISQHPSAIRHFTQWFNEEWTDPKYIFIIGKGVLADQIRKSSVDWHSVPTLGNPGSDVLLVSDNLYRPLQPVGRIPIVEASEIKTYLEKVKLHDQRINDPQSIEARAWAKRVVHLSGGDLRLPNQLRVIRGELDFMKDVISSGMMNAQVETFQKKTTGSVTVSDNQRLTGLINDGVSLVTYFGHSGIQLLDFQIIDDVRTLAPNDRFHVFMAMGCYAGNIFDDTRRSYSETWTLAERRGAVAFIANSSAGFIPSLKNMGSKIYDNYTNHHYGESIGLSVWDGVRKFLEESRNANNELYFSTDVELALSLNICGDPAIRLVAGRGPDYTIDASSVNITEDILTTDVDSFHLDFSLVNIGKTIEDSLWVQIEQILPNGESEIIWDRYMKAPRFRDSIHAVIPNLGERAAGINQLDITVDARDNIEELPGPDAEKNNSLSLINKKYSFFITADDARPVYPEEFAIVGNKELSLIASTSDLHTTDKSYILEIDTTELFNSPLKRDTVIRQKGGTLQWQPAVVWQDDRVYYWRITPDSSGGRQPTWRYSSFIFIEDHAPGWNQSHYYQWQKDNLDSINLDAVSRRWNFLQEFTVLKIKNVVTQDAVFLRPAILRNAGVDWEYYEFSPRNSSSTVVARAGVFVTIYEPTKLDIIQNPSPGSYGSRNESGREIPIFGYKTDEYEDRVALMDLLENHVPSGHYVVVMTVRDPDHYFGIDQWASDRDSTVGRSIFDVWSNLGAKQLDELQSSGEVPYLFVYQQGNPDFSVVEEVGTMDEQFEINVPIAGFWKEGRGEAISTVIGPSSEWGTLLWDYSEIEPGVDEIDIDLIGLDQQGTETLLLSSVTEKNTDISGVDASLYPNLKLKLNSRDKENLTSAQLEYWRVTYASLPEMAIDLNEEFRFYADTVQQGENVELTYTIKNIGRLPTDSILIHYTIIDSKNNEISQEERVTALDVEAKTVVDKFWETKELLGEYRLIVEINPDEDQPELYAWNNTLVLPFFVEGDQRNPILKVTFDDVQIENEDIVSAHPDIVIELTDENQYLPLNDTSLFEIWLTYPEEKLPRAINFDQPEVNFIPASGIDNVARVLIQKRLNKNGIYHLSVNANDISGNESGDINYQVSFQVINAMSISDVQNHPNPFIDFTRFGYTLTGDRSP
ncbi:MAG: C25 family cysteine peptidase, partial [Saprospiraceae bacterium]|nr:C25 family cysteine peptidase [Saprospiraceae bacterium]